MSPMTKDHDIDDILESLEELLLEADAQGDSVHDAAADRPEKEAVKHVDVQQSSFLMSVDVKNDDVEDECEPVMPARVLLTENMLENNPQVLLPLVEKIASDMIEASQIMQVPKIHLRPEMEVGFPAFIAAAKHKDALLQSEILQEKPHKPSLDQAMIEKMLKDVGDDILHQLQLILPKMIQSSLKKHWQDLCDENKESDNHE